MEAKKGVAGFNQGDQELGLVENGHPHPDVFLLRSGKIRLEELDLELSKEFWPGFWKRFLEHIQGCGPCQLVRVFEVNASLAVAREELREKLSQAPTDLLH